MTCREAIVCQETQEELVDALNAYKEKFQSYPKKLQELVPTQIASVPEKVNDVPLKYERTSLGGFALECGYVGPGKNTCTIDELKNWSCNGYY